MLINFNSFQFILLTSSTATRIYIIFERAAGLTRAAFAERCQQVGHKSCLHRSTFILQCTDNNKTVRERDRERAYQRVRERERVNQKWVKNQSRQTQTQTQLETNNKPAAFQRRQRSSHQQQLRRRRSSRRQERRESVRVEIFSEQVAKCAGRLTKKRAKNKVA